MIGVELGYVIGIGIITGAIAMIIAGPIFGKYIGNKIFVEIPKNILNNEQVNIDNKRIPSFGTVVTIILIPLILILLNTLSKVVPALAPTQEIFEFLGTPFVALTIFTVVAMFLLGTRNGFKQDFG